MLTRAHLMMFIQQEMGILCQSTRTEPERSRSEVGEQQQKYQNEKRQAQK